MGTIRKWLIKLFYPMLILDRDIFVKKRKLIREGG
jgi:hypothetical protein